MRRSILSREVRGKATRDIQSEQRGENRVWVNTNSDARLFSLGEQVELITASRTTTAKVVGSIFDERQDVVVKMNEDTANELGLTTRRGIENDIRIRRSKDEVERQLSMDQP